MATNEIFRDGDSLPWKVASGIESGDIVVFASGLVGIAETDAVQREDGAYWATVRTKGVWAIPVTAGTAFVAGISVYASSTPSSGLGVKGTWAGTTSASNTKIGTVYRAASDTDTLVYVRIGG
jgi:predicted RecA/RadA family phage recombinase